MIRLPVLAATAVLAAGPALAQDDAEQIFDLLITCYDWVDGQYPEAFSDLPHQTDERKEGWAELFGYEPLHVYHLTELRYSVTLTSAMGQHQCLIMRNLAESAPDAPFLTVERGGFTDWLTKRVEPHGIRRTRSEGVVDPSQWWDGLLRMSSGDRYYFQVILADHPEQRGLSKLEQISVSGPVLFVFGG